MPATPIHTLTHILRSFFHLHKTRLETMAVIIIGLCLSRTVNLAHLAQHFANAAKPASNYRRLQRFFAAIHFDSTLVARLLMRLAAVRPPWFLAMDRTNWYFGRKPINLLVLAIITRRVRLPILFMVLDKEGSSNAQECIQLLRSYLRIFSVGSIRAVLADREFAMNKLLEFMDENTIPFIVRLKANRYVLPQETKGAWRLQTLLRHQRRRQWHQRGRLKDARTALLHMHAKRLANGEWLIVATNTTLPNPLAAYRKRWGIECLFAHAKKRGFNCEDTHMTHPARLHTLLSLVALAMAWSQAIEREKRRHAATPSKPRGTRRVSSFRLGLQWLRAGICNHEKHIFTPWWRIRSLRPGRPTTKRVV